MSYDSFMKLVNLLMPFLEQNDTKSMNRCGEPAISPPHILGLTIHWLSGSSFHDITDAGNFSRPIFFRLLHKGLEAIEGARNSKYGSSHPWMKWMQFVKALNKSLRRE
jgi:hypothetical protein